MKIALRIALVGAALIFALPVRAETPGVLSASDAHAYNAIFEAQREGNIGKAESLASDLSDKSLMGYVLANRYLESRHYKTSFADLQSWLENYADLPPAERIYKLALKRRPNRKTAVTAPVGVHWRTTGGENENVADASMQTETGARAEARIRAFVKDSNPDGAAAVLKNLDPASGITQADTDHLTLLVAQSYLAEGRDADALALAESAGDHGSANAPLLDWTAGLAAYRGGDYARAAKHFATVAQASVPSFSSSGAAFWAARSFQRAGDPTQVIALYSKAASQPHTFYGVLAARLLGQNINLALVTPTVDPKVFAALMRNRPAHRAVALHQIGMNEYINDELMRAYNDIDPDQAVTFAAIAHDLGDAEIQLKASLLASRRGIYLTTLYPVPAYAPKTGYQLDTALMLAFARQESGFNDDAVSRAGARGVMQVMPATAGVLEGHKKLARKQKKALAVKLDNPEYNMALGQKYLLDLLGSQSGNLFQLAAAYNAGPANLSRWLAAHEGNDDPLLFIESIPIRETRLYIKQVMMNFWMYEQSMGQKNDTLDDAAAGQWPTYAPGGNAFH